jgi:hypothetical protein
LPGGLSASAPDNLKTVPPTTAEGIERYLGSGLVKGIGPNAEYESSGDKEEQP